MASKVRQASEQNDGNKERPPAERSTRVSKGQFFDCQVAKSIFFKKLTAAFCEGNSALSCLLDA